VSRKLGAGGIRALAINRNGTYGSAIEMSTDKAAKKAALADYQNFTRLPRSCFIYAVGE